MIWPPKRGEDQEVFSSDDGAVGTLQPPPASASFWPGPQGHVVASGESGLLLQRPLPERRSEVGGHGGSRLCVGRRRQQPLEESCCVGMSVQRD